MVFRTSIEAPRKLPRHLRNEEIPSQFFTPRTYQVDLLDVAIQQNTVVCLGSDIGKSFVGVMLVKELSHHVRSPIAEGGKRSVYLVKTENETGVPAQCIQQYTDLSVCELPDGNDVENWEPEEWRDELLHNHVIVTTFNIFYKFILNIHLPLSSVNIIVLEDCHLVLEEDSVYSNIMKSYRELSSLERPRLIGFTTALLKGCTTKPEELASILLRLEETLCSVAETSNLVTAERYGPCPKLVAYECDEEVTPEDLSEHLQAILESALAFLFDCNVPDSSIDSTNDPRAVPTTALSECLHILHQLGPWCCATIATTFLKQLEKIDSHEDAELAKQFLKFATTQLRLVNRVFEEHFASVWQVEEFLTYVTPKVAKLIQAFKDYKPVDDFMIIAEDENMSDSDMSDDSMDLSDGDDEDTTQSKQSKPIHIAVKRTSLSTKQPDNPFVESEDTRRLCGVVFVERRHVAYALNKLIDEMCAWDTDLYFLKSHHILGDGMKRGGKREALLFKKQEEILRKFRMQELNLLVSTSVLEEGVDIPKCNLVVRFDLPRDYRSYTLSKSRACARNAQFVLLVDKSCAERFNNDLQEYKGIESVLLEKCQNRSIVLEEYPIEKLKEDLLPPYQPIKGEGNACVTMTSAISLVNRYCAKLPSDAFTHLTPKCHLVSLDASNQKFYAKLRLPINSPVKDEIQGEVMAGRRLAQMAVALKTCEILHKEGELDDQLLPVGKEVFRYENEENDWEEEVEEGQARPGTTKRKQYYIKQSAQDFLNCCPKPDINCVLYEIKMKLTGPITDDQNTRGRKIHAPDETTRSFGILLTNEIPRVPLFPVYTRSGEVTVCIQLINNNIQVTQEEMDQLLVFHKFVFSSVLRLEKDPMEFSVHNENISYVVVPLNQSENTEGSLDIDWDFVVHLGTVTSPVEQAKIYDAKREKFEFKTEQFQDAVVMPSYRNIDQPQYFYVAEIRNDLTPLSPFPSPDLYKTFKDYYAVKYGLMITNTDQPLLDVDHTSARLNLLTPRYMNQKGVALPTSSADTKRSRRENLQQKQILIPELCDVHVFPASLWRKAVCLPTILYRTNHLLIAEDLRVRISRETQIGVEKVPKDFQFPKLDFGFNTSPENVPTESEQDSDVIKRTHSQISMKKTPTYKNTKDLESQKTSKIDSTKTDSELLKSDKNNSSKLVSCNEVLNEDLSYSSREKSKDCEQDCSEGNQVCDKADQVCDKADQVCDKADQVCDKADQVCDVTNQVCDETDQVCDVTNQVCDVTNQVCDEKNQVLDETNQVLDETNQVLDETNQVLDETNQVLDETNHVCDHDNQNYDNQEQVSKQNSIKKDSNEIYHVASQCSQFSDKSNQYSDSSKTISDKGYHVINGSNQDSDEGNHIFDKSNLISVESNHISHNGPQDSDNGNQDSDKSNLISVESNHISHNGPQDSDEGNHISDKSNLISVESNHISHKGPQDSDNGDQDSDKSNLISAESNHISHKGPQDSDEEIQCTQDYKCNSRKEDISIDNDCDGIIETANARKLKLSHEPAMDSMQNQVQSLKIQLINENQVKIECCMENTNDFKASEARFGVPYENHTAKSALEYAKNTEFPTYENSKNTEFPTFENLKNTEFPTFENAKNAEFQGSSMESNNDIKQSDINIKFVKPDLPDNFDLPVNMESVDEPTGWDDLPVDENRQKTMELLGSDVLKLSDIGIVDLISTNQTSKTSQSETSENFKSTTSANQESLKDKKFKGSTPEKPSATIKELQRSPQNDASKVCTSKLNSYDSDSKNNFTFNEDTKTDTDSVTSKKSTDALNCFRISHFQCEAEAEVNCTNDHLGSKGSKDLVTNNDLKERKDIQDITENEECLNLYDKDIGDSISPSTVQNCQAITSNSNIIPPESDVQVSLNFLPNEKCSTIDSSAMKNQPKDQFVSLDKDVDLETFIGPSPCILLQALTMSNANDFFSLERLETIGDSFLKYAITVYLYCTYPGIHEGKLSYLRSKQVSNCNLYRLGKRKGLPESMVSAKFEPNENWLPSGYIINEGKQRGPVQKVPISSCFGTKKPTNDFINVSERQDSESGSGVENSSVSVRVSCNHRSNGSLSRSSRMANIQQLKFKQELEEVSRCQEVEHREDQYDGTKLLLPYNLRTQHIIPDKSVADTVEALIGCYLTSCGKRGALLFMSWLGLHVFPKKDGFGDSDETQTVNQFEELKVPPSPQLQKVSNSDQIVQSLLDGYDVFEESIGYRFQDRSYLLQAFTHASYHYNIVTDCYQRLEFLGDAILDYVITRHLFEDSRKYSPGVLTDLRSALVNNNIFAALAVKWDFHKFFKAVSPALFHVIERFVSRQKDNQDLIQLDDEEDDSDGVEKVEMEIPKALGDIFESVAGAVYLDSGMSLDVVWAVYHRMMKPQIDQYLERIPKSPVRELLEMEPETAKFEKPERTMDGKIRVTVNVVGKGVFTGLGRNYRIAKSSAAKKALKNIKTMQEQGLI